MSPLAHPTLAAWTPAMARPVDRPRTRVAQVAPWTGSDGAMHDAICAVLGPHDAYFGLCCGGLGALLAKRKSPIETVCDLHGGLILLAMVIASDRWIDLEAKCARVLPSEPLYASCREALSEPHPVPASPNAVTDADVRVAWCYAVVWWLGMGGHAGSGQNVRGDRRDKAGKMSVRATPGGGTGPSRFRAFTGSLAWLHERLSNVHVLVRDCFQMFDPRGESPAVPDRVGQVVYIDPPFIAEGQMYTMPWDVHDPASTPLFQTQDDFDRFAELADLRVRSRVIVRHYQHERLEALFPRAEWTRVWLPGARRQMGHEAGAGEDARPGRVDGLLIKNIRSSELSLVPAGYTVEPANDVDGWSRYLDDSDTKGADRG
jgi:hypothetical protein